MANSARALTLDPLIEVHVGLPVLVFGPRWPSAGEYPAFGGHVSFAIPEQSSQGQASLAYTADRAVYRFLRLYMGVRKRAKISRGCPWALAQGRVLGSEPRICDDGRFPAPASARDFAMPAGGRLAQDAASQLQIGGSWENRLWTLSTRKSGSPVGMSRNRLFCSVQTPCTAFGTTLDQLIEVHVGIRPGAGESGGPGGVAGPIPRPGRLCALSRWRAGRPRCRPARSGLSATRSRGGPLPAP